MIPFSHHRPSVPRHAAVPEWFALRGRRAPLALADEARRGARRRHRGS